MYRLVMANKYKKGEKFKSFELYKWAETKKELENNLNKTTKLFLGLLKTKKILRGKLNYGIMEVVYDKKLLDKTKIKDRIFLESD